MHTNLKSRLGSELSFQPGCPRSPEHFSAITGTFPVRGGKPTSQVSLSGPSHFTDGRTKVPLLPASPRLPTSMASSTWLVSWEQDIQANTNTLPVVTTPICLFIYVGTD